ncbi:hypothetical protein K435DRAFT_860658 [Dendrothele bispora CBS 962.96]|uniref:Uncharacterized protein n=1 Tax=Dendrothele bispora (strain CBS 962.96) TaxID=1314807 RepID=A0A4S8LXP4_DENBC|nr:hypothetical protein K435DRAFT_860658 [Dendrothele bispora CBS 962.96]
MSRSPSTTEDTTPSYTANSPSDTSAVATSSGIQLRRDADLLIQHFLLPSPPDRTSSQDEQCRPDDHGESTNQETDRCTGDCTFSSTLHPSNQQGYNDQLHSLGISQEMLLNFIDPGLKLAILASPPLVASLLGRAAIGFVAYHCAMIPSVIIVTTAKLGIKPSRTVTSIQQTSTSSIHEAFPIDQKKGKTKVKLNKFGRGVGSALLNSPIPILLVGPIIRAIADKPVPIPPGETAEGAVLRRRLMGVQEAGLAISLRHRYQKVWWTG